MVYLFCEKPGTRNTTGKTDFEEFINNFFAKNKETKLEDLQVLDNSLKSDDKSITKPNILFSLYYSHVDSNKMIKYCQNLPDNLHIVSGSKVELDFDFHIEQAKTIFDKICPSEKFLPKPPDQEDIIFGEEDKGEIDNNPKENDLSDN